MKKHLDHFLERISKAESTDWCWVLFSVGCGVYCFCSLVAAGLRAFQ